jgi:outer membrane receptor protein involved in Fe transport
VKWNARLSLASADDRWELALVGRNLTDKTTSSFGDATFQSPGVYFGNVDAPRQIFINATWRFW